MQLRDVERGEGLCNTSQRIGSRTRVAFEASSSEQRHSTDAGFEVDGRLSRSASKTFDAGPEARREPLELVSALRNLGACITELAQ